MASKQANKARLKALRRKYHLGEFSRGKKKHPHIVPKNKRRVVVMAKKSRVKRMARSFVGNLGGYIVGGFAFAFAEGFILKMADKLAGSWGTYGVIAVEGLALWFIAKKTSGLISQIAKVGIGIVAYQLGKQIAGNIGILSGSSTSSVTIDSVY